MRTALPCPRRPLMAVAVLAAASGLLACEGKIAGNAPGRGGSGGDGTVAGTAGTTGGTGTAGSAPVPTSPDLFGACPSGGGEPGVSPLVKLSTIQYRNTVRDLLAASGPSAGGPEKGPRLAASPGATTGAVSGPAAG